MTDVWTLKVEDVEDSDGFDAPEYYAVRGQESVHLDWSRFAHYEPRHFDAMVALSFPRRSDFGLVGPLSPAAIDAAAGVMA